MHFIVLFLYMHITYFVFSKNCSKKVLPKGQWRNEGLLSLSLRYLKEKVGILYVKELSSIVRGSEILPPGFGGGHVESGCPPVRVMEDGC